MTESEINAIVDQILTIIRENSKTIEQLTPVGEMGNDDLIEINQGRSISFRALADQLVALEHDEVVEVISRLNQEIIAREQGDTTLSNALEALAEDVTANTEALSGHQTDISELQREMGHKLDKSSVVNILGDSSTSPISQSAVKDAMSALAVIVSANRDRIDELEKFISIRRIYAVESVVNLNDSTLNRNADTDGVHMVFDLITKRFVAEYNGSYHMSWLGGDTYNPVSPQTLYITVSEWEAYIYNGDTMIKIGTDYDEYIEDLYQNKAEKSQVNTLSEALAEETAARESLSGKVDGHTADISSLESNKADKTALSAEAEAREGADAALGEAINDEATAREGADNALGGRVSSLEISVDDNAGSIAALQSGKADRSELEESAEALGSAIEDETLARQGADAALGGRIDAEAVAREGADAELAGAIEAAEGRLAADAATAVAELTAAIGDEATEREEADAALGGRIDALETAVGDGGDLSGRIAAVEEAIAEGVGTVKGITVNGTRHEADADGVVHLTIEEQRADESLDENSTNPVQNQAIATKVNEIEDKTLANIEVDEGDENVTLRFLNKRGLEITSAEIPAIGGGGGGNASGEYTKVIVSASVDHNTIKEGGRVNLTWGYRSEYAGGDRTGDAGVRATVLIEIRRGASTVYRNEIYDVQSGTGDTLDISEALAAGSHDIYVRATITDPITDTTRTRQAYTSVYVSAMSLTTEFSLTGIVSSGGLTAQILPIRYTVSGSGVKNLRIYYDGTLLSDSPTGIQLGVRTGQYNLMVGGNNGRHSVQMVAAAMINGIEMLSDSIYFDIFKGEGQAFTLIKMSRVDGRIFSRSETPTIEVGQYDPCSIQYAAYDPENEEATVNVIVGTNAPQTFVVARTMQDLNLRFNERTENNIPVNIGIAGNGTNNANRQIAVAVTASLMNVALADDYTHMLTADGRSNSESGRNQWKDAVTGTNVATFVNVDWATSGWIDGAMKLINGAKMVIDYRLFARDITATGMTVEVLMRVSNVANRLATLVDCVDATGGTEKGLRITSDKISYVTGTTVEYVDEDGNAGIRPVLLSTNYASDVAVANTTDKKWMLVSFVVSRASDIKLMELYIDGNRVGADEYAGANQFVQDTPRGITFDSEGADLEIKRIRVYERALTDDELIDNSIVEEASAAEMVRKYQENQVLDDSSDISMDKLIRQGKGVLHIIRQRGLDELYETNDKKKDFPATVIYYPSAEAKRQGAKAFRAENCNIRIQGTSSTKYPSKNIRIYLNKPDGMVLYVDGNVASDKKYSLKDGVPAQSVLCAKADYSDSSMSLNTGGAKMFNDTMIRMGLLTPPQSYEREAGGNVDTAITKRSAIFGWPVDIFASDTEQSELTYYGQYNLNNEKSKSADVFGMSSFETFTADVPIALESLNNQEGACLFAATGDVEEYLAQNFDRGMEVNYSVNGADGDANWSGTEGKAALSNEEKSAIIRLYSFIQACKPNGADLGANNAPINIDTWQSDRFRNEASQYFDVRYLCAYYLWTDYFLAVDQRAKNILWRTWDGLVWYPTYYDGDTQMGKRNDSFMVYDYATDRNSWDAQASKRAFEGYRSWLWNLVLANFSDTLSAVANSMRLALSNNDVLDMYLNEQMGNWCDRVYNKSGYIKYIRPQFVPCYGNAQEPAHTWKFIYALQGANKEHREYMVRNRFAVLDAKYCCGEFRNDTIEFYLKTGDYANFKLWATETYAFAHSKKNGGMLGNTGVIGPGVEAQLEIEGGGANDPLSIYGASRILKLDCTEAASSFYGNLNLNKCTAMQELDLSAPNADGASRAWSFSVDGCRQLRRVSVRNQTFARTGSETNTTLDFSGCTRLEEVDARGVNVTEVELAPGAPVRVAKLGATLQRIEFDHLPELSYGNGSLTFESLASVRDVEVKGCGQLSGQYQLISDWMIQKQTDSSRCTLAATGIEWTGVTARQMISLAALKHKDEQGNLANGPDLQGTVVLSAAPTQEEAMQLVEAYGAGCFSGTGRLKLRVQGGTLMLIAPTSVAEGSEREDAAIVRGIVLDPDFGNIVLSATLPGSSDAVTSGTATQGDVSVEVDRENLMVRIWSTEAGSERTVTVKIQGNKPGQMRQVARVDVQIRKRVYPSAFEVEAPAALHPGRSYDISLTPSTTEGVDGLWRTSWRVEGSDKVTLTNQSATGCRLAVAADAEIEVFTLIAEVYRGYGATPYLTYSWVGEVLTAEVLMTSRSNPEVMAICYAQGWAAHEGYMTYDEAAAVTSIGTAFENSNIVHFDEFEFFTSLVVTSTKMSFNSCRYLRSIKLPIVTGGYAPSFRNVKNLREIVVPEGYTMLPANMFYDCNVEKVVIPSTVVYMELIGTQGAHNIREIYCYASSAPRIQNDNFWSFEAGSNWEQEQRVLYLPQGATGYDTSTGWQVLSVGGFTFSYTL